jgi:hypothetical protein
MSRPAAVSPVPLRLAERIPASVHIASSSQACRSERDWSAPSWLHIWLHQRSAQRPLAAGVSPLPKLERRPADAEYRLQPAARATRTNVRLPRREPPHRHGEAPVQGRPTSHDSDQGGASLDASAPPLGSTRAGLLASAGASTTTSP